MSGFVYQSGAAAYRQLRRGKNRLLNLVDAPVLVLIYHRVAVLPADPHQLAVSPENFLAQMRFLKQHFPLVRFEDDWAGCGRPAVAVTFDDGYADNFLQALPILEELEVPATFFVSTATLDSQREFWWDDLERLILTDAPRPQQFQLDDPDYSRTWPTASVEERGIFHRELQALVEMIGAERREGWLTQLRAWAGADPAGREANRALSHTELHGLAASPWATIGAHTITHTPLALLSAEQQRQEILGSKRVLESLLDREIRVFSYPFGRRLHYNRDSLRLCREAGFVRAAANFPGQVHRWTDPFQIPRQLVRNWDAATFTAKLQGFWA